MAGLPAHQLKDGRRVRRSAQGHGRDGQVPKVCKDHRETTSSGVARQRSQDPKCARLKRARPEEMHGEEESKGSKGVSFAEGQSLQHHRLQRMQSPAGLTWPGAPRSTRGLGLARWVGLETRGVRGGHALLRIISILPLRRNPGPAQADTGPRAEFRSEEQPPERRRQPRNRPRWTLPETARAAAPASECVTVGAGGG